MTPTGPNRGSSGEALEKGRKVKPASERPEKQPWKKKKVDGEVISAFESN
jgi:hypothetical protein